MSTREPFWRKYIDAAAVADIREGELVRISELTFAQEATRWFARGGIK